MRLIDQYHSNDVIRRLEFIAKSDIFVALCGQSDIIVFQLGGPLTPTSRFNTGYKSVYNAPLALHPTNKWLCVSTNSIQFGGPEMPLKVFNWSDGTIEKEYMVPGDEIQATCFSPDGKWLVTSNPDGFYSCIELENECIEWQFPSDEANCFVCFHPNSKIVMVSYYQAWEQWGSAIDFWEVGVQMLPSGDQPTERWEKASKEAKERGSIVLPYDYIQAAVFSPVGDTIAISHWHPALYSYPEKRFLKAFDLEGNCINHSFGESRIDRTRFWTKPVFTPDSSTVLYGSPDGLIFRWDIKSGKLLEKTEAHKGRILDISLSSDGKSLVSCGSDSILRAWAVCQCLRDLAHYQFLLVEESGLV